MAVQSATTSITYSGNDSTVTAYVIPFLFYKDTHIQAIITDADGVEAELDLTTDFTVTGEGDEDGGNLLTVEAWDNTHELTIRRKMPATQPFVFEEGQRLGMKTLEKALDYLLMFAAWIRDESAGNIPQFQTSATHIQWKYPADTEWTDLVALADIGLPAYADDIDSFLASATATTARAAIDSAKIDPFTVFDDGTEIYADADTSTQKPWVVTSGTGTTDGDGAKHVLAATVASTMTRFRRYCNFDLSSHAVILDLIKDANLASIKVTLYCGDTGSPKTLATPAFNGATMFTGKLHRMAVAHADYVITGSPTAGDLRNIWAIDLDITPTTSNTTDLQLLELSTVKHDKIPRVCFQFDDGRDDTYSTAAPILAANGFLGDIAADITVIDTADHCTLAQLQELYADGWSIMGHHDTAMHTLAESAQIDVHLAVRNYLSENNFIRGADVFVYPGGSYNAAIDNIASRFWKVRRPVQIRSYFSIPGAYDPKAPGHVYIANGVPVSTYKLQIDRAKAAGETVIFVLHGVVESPVASEDYSTALFTELVEYAAAQGMTDIRYPDIFTPIL